MNSDRRTKVSKYLSRIRRVAPDAVGLTLEVGGWVRVADLRRACGSAD
jgi:RNA:NAD 2'-phosphotransferase (TPT1/KptA family)